MPKNDTQKANDVLLDENLQWQDSPTDVHHLMDENGNVLATVELVPKFYPPTYTWVLTARHKNGKPIKGWEFGKAETQQAALNGLSKVLKKTVSVKAPTESVRLPSEDEASVTLLVRTNAKNARKIVELSNQKVLPGLERDESGFVAYDEGPAILQCIGNTMEAKPPDWNTLDPKLQESLIVAAASSLTWRPQNEVDPELVDEVFEEYPTFEAMFTTKPEV